MLLNIRSIADCSLAQSDELLIAAIPRGNAFNPDIQLQAERVVEIMGGMM